LGNCSILRTECANRQIKYSSKDGVETLFARLRTNDKMCKNTAEMRLPKLGLTQLLEQFKSQSENLVEPSDFHVGHDYGEREKISRVPRLLKVQKPRTKGVLNF
jgi:hypothetical protein